MEKLESQRKRKIEKGDGKMREMGQMGEKEGGIDFLYSEYIQGFARAILEHAPPVNYTFYLKFYWHFLTTMSYIINASILALQAL